MLSHDVDIPPLESAAEASRILKHSAFGFTLSELLISLAILGVIATFTIPKVLQSQQDQHKKAVFKETIAAVNDALYTGLLTGELTKGLNGCDSDEYNYAPYIASKLNAVKLCPNQSGAEGCWTQAIPDAAQLNQPGFVLHNGLTVAGLEKCEVEGNNTWFIMDWNGAASPNLEGNDQLWLRFCSGTGCPSSIRQGQILSHTTYPLSNALFQSLFQ